VSNILLILFVLAMIIVPCVAVVALGLWFKRSIKCVACIHIGAETDANWNCPELGFCTNPPGRRGRQAIRTPERDRRSARHANAHIPGAVGALDAFYGGFCRCIEVRPSSVAEAGAARARILRSVFDPDIEQCEVLG
jgi:hypothetical protein